MCVTTCTGGLSQDQRLEAMSKLKQYQCRVLISTDLVRRTDPLRRAAINMSPIATAPVLTYLLQGSLIVFSYFIRVFFLCALPFPSDFQRYRCRQSKPGDKPGCAAGLGDVHAPNWTGWTLRLVSNAKNEHTD